jgi:methionyl-tRNA synthetase
MKANPTIIQKSKKILITSALPYVNNVPHLGNIIGATLSGDVFSRFCKSYGCETLYICGTDEHGTSTEVAALKENLTPKQITDKYHTIHKQVYDWFNIKFDEFSRTTSEDNKKITYEIFKKLDENGYIIEDDLDQMYDEKAQKFLADRFVEGTCPKCGYEDARGDQCDECSTLLDPVDLINPRSKLTGTTPVVKTERHIFIDLPKLSTQIKEWVEKTAKQSNWSKNAIAMTNAWLRDGLKPRCISRSIKWGFKIPKAGFEDKVFYSWFDAPIGYIGSTISHTKDWKNWWKNPQDTQLYQFMGKDNIPFHTIMFPAFLIGAKDNYTLLHQISSTEYINYEGGQFSKSRNRGVFGTQAKESGIDADIFRYYLLINRPEQSDSEFTWKDFQTKNNNELLANLGNFVNRTLTFTKKHFDGKIEKRELNEILRNNVEQSLDKITIHLSNIELKESLKQVMHISKLANQYFQEQEPWKLVKVDLVKCHKVLYNCLELLRKLAIVLEPFMPQIANKILNMLGINKQQTWEALSDIKESFQIQEIKILFRKIENDEIEKLKNKFSGKKMQDTKETNNSETKNQINENQFPLKLRVGQIVEVKDHPNADSLYLLQVDFKEEKRQIVAGLKKQYKPEELLNKKSIFLMNLKPAKIRGEASNAMSLVAEDEEKFTLLFTNESVGSIATFEGLEENENQITYDKFQKIDMRINKGFVIYNTKKLLVNNNPIKVVGVNENAKIM